LDIETIVRPDGDVRVHETIVQDFGVVPRHGIERVIPLRDGVGEHRISDLVVSTSAGTPDAVKVSPMPDEVTIRIGDAGRTIAGPHTYRLEYDLGGVTEPSSTGRSQLRLDAISAWQQPIDSLRYTVVAPGEPEVARCYRGSVGSRDPCDATERTATGATFAARGVAVEEAFTVDLQWPTSVVAVSADDSWFDAADAVYAVLVGLAVGAVAWWYRRRWRQLYADARTQLWSTFGPDVVGPQVESYDLAGEPAIEFVPPMSLRPGEMGALVEAGHTELLTATVVDLAARGAMRITDREGSWELERRNGAVRLTDDEQHVMTTLFASGDRTDMEDRGTEMGGLSAELAEQLTDDLEDRELAVRGIRNSQLRARVGPARILVLGLVAVVIGSGLHFLVVTLTGDRGFALVLETIAALGLVTVGGWLIVRGAARGITPKGLAARWRVRGFDRFFTDSEAMHARGAADRGLLRQYMGYAIVFGHVHQWVSAFDSPDTSEWFVTDRPLGAAFVGFTAGSMWSPPASSSSSGFSGGFSGAGGGSGGGGGGSW
jgi:hypothetical protein